MATRPAAIDPTTPKFRKAVEDVFTALENSPAPMLTRVKAITYAWEHRAYGLAVVPTDAEMLTIITDIDRAVSGLTAHEALFVTAEVMDRSNPVKVYQALGEAGFVAALAKHGPNKNEGQ